MRDPRNHLLFTLAKSYPANRDVPSPSGCRYDHAAGAWLSLETGGLYVESPDRPRQETKKNDVETGEDQRSE